MSARASASSVPVPAPAPVLAARRDLDGIIALELRCFGPVDRFSRATWRHLLGPAAARGSSLTLVVRESGAVIASANGLMRVDSAMVRLYSLAVDPQQRGRGLGKAMILALMRRAPKRCSVISLEVRADNHGARRLYEGLGFTVHRELPGYYPDGGDGVSYRASRATLLRRAATRQ